MKNKILPILIVGLLVLTFCISTNAKISKVDDNNQDIKVSYHFSKPSFEKMDYEDQVFDQIKIKELENTGKPGVPSLPLKGAFILIPSNKKVKDINVYGEKHTIDGNYLINPVSKAFINSNDKQDIKLKYDFDLFDKNKFYPDRIFDNIDVLNFRGYKILILNLYPVQYQFKYGKINYYSNLNVEIELEDDKSSNNFFRGLEKDEIAVGKIVDNPEIISSYNIKTNVNLLNDGYDLLIITTDDLKTGFQTLVDYHNNNGVNTIVKTMSDLQGNSPLDVKNFIIDSYNQYGIEYVLLGSDEPDIPVHYSEAYNPALRQDELIPSDQWYCLFDDDLMPEINIGRACVDNLDEVDNFVTKTINYASNTDVEEYDSCLMVGQKLLPLTYGGNYMDELINECDNNDEYIDPTEGIPETRYHMVKLYERYYEWDKTELLGLINNDDFYLINHLGHGHFYHIMKLEEPFTRTQSGELVESNDITNLVRNNRPFFLYSQACYAGSFDNTDYKGNRYEEDCIGEYLTVKTDYGAFAAIMNSRYGLGTLLLTLGPNQFFHREFWDSVFDDDIYSIGQANQQSKIKNLNRIISIPELSLDYSYWEITLFGDPTVEIKVPSAKYPMQPSTPTFSGINKTNTDITFSTSTSDPNNDELYYLFDWGDGTTSEWIGPIDSGEIVKEEHSWNSEGKYLVRVKAKDIDGYESQWSEPTRISVSKVKAKLFSDINLRFFQKFILIFDYILERIMM